MPIFLPEPQEAEGTYLAYPVVRYLLSLSSVPKANRCLFKDIWSHLLLGAFTPDDYDIRSSILWGKGIPSDAPSNFWVLSVLQRVERGGKAWPNTLLVVGYRRVPSSLANGEDRDELGIEDSDVPPDSPDWYTIYNRLEKHLAAISHVNTSIPEFVAVTVGRFVRFFRVENNGKQIVSMEGDPVYDIAFQNHAVQQILTFINEGREVVKMSGPPLEPGSFFG